MHDAVRVKASCSPSQKKKIYNRDCIVQSFACGFCIRNKNEEKDEYEKKKINKHSAVRWKPRSNLRKERTENS